MAELLLVDQADFNIPELKVTADRVFSCFQTAGNFH